MLPENGNSFDYTYQLPLNLSLADGGLAGVQAVCAQNAVAFQPADSCAILVISANGTYWPLFISSTQVGCFANGPFQIWLSYERVYFLPGVQIDMTWVCGFKNNSDQQDAVGGKWLQ